MASGRSPGEEAAIRIGVRLVMLLLSTCRYSQHEAHESQIISFHELPRFWSARFLLRCIADKAFKMKFQHVLAIWGLASTARAKVFDRQPLSYAAIPEGTYVPPNDPGETTLLGLINSREDLSELAKLVNRTPGESNHSPSHTLKLM